VAVAEPGGGAVQEPGAGGRLLVGVDLGVGDAGVVVDGDVDEVEAGSDVLAALVVDVVGAVQAPYLSECPRWMLLIGMIGLVRAGQGWLS
jgi:hypothetical protein